METQIRKKNLFMRFLDDIWFEPQPAVVILIVMILIFIAVVLNSWGI